MRHCLFNFVVTIKIHLSLPDLSEFSSSGCDTVWKRGQSHITCSCDHLTFFGVLMVNCVSESCSRTLTEKKCCHAYGLQTTDGRTHISFDENTPTTGVSFPPACWPGGPLIHHPGRLQPLSLHPHHCCSALHHQKVYSCSPLFAFRF